MIATFLSLAGSMIPPEWKALAVQSIAAALPPVNASESNSPSAPTPSAPAPSTPGDYEIPAAPNKATGKSGSADKAMAKAIGLQLVTALRANTESVGLIKKFQRAAKVAVDGDYGPMTAGALAFFTGQTILPKKGPKHIVPYTPQ